MGTERPEPEPLDGGVIHLKVSKSDLSWLDAEGARMESVIGGGRFSRADVLRIVLKRAQNPQSGARKR